MRSIAAYRPSAEQAIAVIVDVETTGLDHRRDEVIEIGMVAFVHDQTGRVGPVVGALSLLREPSVEITPEITRLTGITPEMVAGQVLDLDAVRRLLEPADLVIAHNAQFDRNFCERLHDDFCHKAWACSVAEVRWSELGYEGAKLGYLVTQNGWFHRGHRAVDDCHATLEILATDLRDGSGSALGHLLASSRRSRVRVWAERAPFDMKDVLKRRGYRWNGGDDGRPKAWWTEVDEEDLARETALSRDRGVPARGRSPAGDHHRLRALSRFLSPGHRPVAAARRSSRYGRQTQEHHGGGIDGHPAEAGGEPSGRPRRS